jgi:hypothetical protein
MRRLADVARPRLYANTATTVEVNFRDSGITWLAVAGVDLARMPRRAGHDEIKTTLDYVKQAEDLTGKIGVPFGPLPADLLGEPSAPPSAQVAHRPPPKPRRIGCRRRESKPLRM